MRLVGSETDRESRPAVVIPARSASMRKALYLARRACPHNFPVLLLGETGVGKDYLARWIHERSFCSDGPYLAINCAALPGSLAESELFGHEAGAYTGAGCMKPGLVEVADGGTLLLNEIGDLDLVQQAKLLTFLDTRSFIRVGGTKVLHSQARIVAATNRDLVRDVRRGAFRSDLFYRLNVLTIAVPPLRKRRMDFPLLTGLLLEDLGVELGRDHTPRLSNEALSDLVARRWPGNIRELRNVLHRSLILSGEPLIEPHHLEYSDGDPLDASSSPRSFTCESDLGFHDAVDEFKRWLIVEAFRSTRSVPEVAASLRISRYSLYHQVKVLGLSRLLPRAPSPV